MFDLARNLIQALIIGGAVALVVVFLPHLRTMLTGVRLVQDFKRLSGPAYRAIELAVMEARRLEHRDLGTEHLLLGILAAPGSTGAIVLRVLGTDVSGMRRYVENMVWRVGRPPGGRHLFTVNFVDCVRRAVEESRRDGQDVASTAHLLIGLLEDGGGVAACLLETYGVTTAAVREAMQGMDTQEPPQPS